jgi:hypothetical protein
MAMSGVSRLGQSRILLLVLGVAWGLWAHPAPERIIIEVQPRSQTVLQGRRATFSVLATARGGRLQYQWYRRPGPGRDRGARQERIPGATDPVYSTPAVEPGQNGSEYFARLTCGRTEVDSRRARLNVLPALAVPSAELALPVSVHPGDGWMEASVPVQEGMDYAWTVLKGSGRGRITEGQGSGVVRFSAGDAGGAFQLQVAVRNRAGAKATSARTVTIQGGTSLVENGGAAVARHEATATLLPSGRVLVVGGRWHGYPSLDIPSRSLASVELYDPATGAWVATGRLAEGRFQHTATLLPDGSVLVVGGYGDAGSLASAERYDPRSGAWSPAAGLALARGGHTATLMGDGTVLVAGGSGLYGPNGALPSSERYDPGQNAWKATGRMGTARTSQTATRLPDGKVLVAGGNGVSGTLASAECYDPARGVWLPAASLGTPRTGHTATLLADRTVLVAGGYDVGARAERYDPDKPAWVPMPGLGTARAGHTATPLPDGTVLVAGGAGASAERYHPATRAWSATGPLGVARSAHSATLLLDGTVLVAGGRGVAPMAAAELYHPALGLWLPTASMAVPRYGHTATRLPDGTVLVAGGYADGPTAQAELYQPATGTWKPLPAMAVARVYHTATLLKDGTVLIAGGAGRFSPVATERYDPLRGVWIPSGTLDRSRSRHTATLLQDGRVLVAGGSDGDQPSNWVDLYDPATGAWTPAANLGEYRRRHTATLLPDGSVLVAGGDDASQTPFATRDTSEIYRPSAGTWTPAAPLATPRTAHTATLLADGTILLAFGQGGDVVTEILLP